MHPEAYCRILARPQDRLFTSNSEGVGWLGEEGRGEEERRIKAAQILPPPEKKGQKPLGFILKIKAKKGSRRLPVETRPEEGKLYFLFKCVRACGGFLLLLLER